MQLLMGFLCLVLNRNALGYSETNHYGTITLIKPSYVNRPVTLKIITLPQNSVVVGPQFGDFFKTKCVNADTGIDVFCKTDFRIKPLNVSFEVGRQVLSLVVEGKQPDMHKFDHTSFRLKKDMVGSNLTWTVLYSANEDPMEFTARLCFVSTQENAVYQTCAKGNTMSSMTEYRTRTGIFSRQTSHCTQSTDYMTPISRTDRSGPISLTKLRNIDSEHIISKEEQHYEVPLQHTGNDAEEPMVDTGYIDMSG
ncbi:hypothetical protein MAR_021540 [Mya arenaria]|uniref:Uncharacterized protein n=1 Tax=Mya arenaria TaxID=6604 RepID=A0ABY7EBB3_MYAAR|nr:hypothetical protein MAR_021540 [Mya arenaria]